ncbi:MAG TPA: ferritin-like domain-containing protein [Blastococcus sp.]|nr:ferritin-like domain-containing protein [Blastococcus sp.]
MPADKLQPRNRTARLAQGRAAGNPVVTELESGVGNCFPGLEIDLRNLDRRFFPFLTVDFVGDVVLVVEVALARAQQEQAAAPLLQELTALAADPPGSWQVTRLAGDLAGLGPAALVVADLGTDPALPPDPWTAVRLIRPGTTVQLTLQQAGAQPRTLTGTRVSYLSDDGAFAEMFEAGELTQSLCSPWTHDFRDCGCFYWASNHPDIVQPALPPGVEADDPDWTVRTNWLRSDKLAAPPPTADQQHSGEMAHHEINHRWQELDVVLDGREQREPYDPTSVAGLPLDPDRLVPTLRFAAGVELAVMLEYLAAAFSIDPLAGSAQSTLRGDARAARAEVLRVAASEMRHLRVVNALLLDAHQASGTGSPFDPALGVATEVPDVPGAPGRPVQFRPLTPAVLDEFVQVEAPSLTVDALYSRILATFQRDGRDANAATVLAVMAEGADHFATFTTVQEWLGRHPGTPYLRTLRTPAPGDPVLATVQQRYERVLGLLHSAYRVGIPAGAADVAAARTAMLGPSGIEGACEALARDGVLPVFAVPADPRFAPVAPPP